MATAAELYNTLSPGRKAALHAEFQFRYAPNSTKSDYLLQPQLFQQFLQTPEALSTLMGTGFQPGVTPNQAPAQTQNEAQYAQGRQLRDLAEAKIGQNFLPVQQGLNLAQLMARIEPGRITTPQFNIRANTHNFGEFLPTPTPNTGVVAQPGDSPIPSVPSFTRPQGMQGRTGPSQQELVNTVQSGLRLGRRGGQISSPIFRPQGTKGRIY